MKTTVPALLRTATLVAAIAAMTVGCAGAGGGGASQTFGVSLNSLEYPMVVLMNDAMKEQADKQSVNLSVGDARNKVATELTQIEDLITRKPSVIIMDPVDAKSSQAAGRLVNKAKIPLMLFDNNFSEDSTVDVASYVGSDAIESGRLQAQFLNESLPQGGKIIYLVGIYGAPWTERRKTGFYEVLNKNFDVATETEAHGTRADGKTVMEDLLHRYSSPGEIVAVVAQNDEMAIGAISAIKEAGRHDEFKAIISADGSKPALDAVKDGSLTATVAQDPTAVGDTTVTTAVDVASGKPVERTIHIPQTVVTAKNIAEHLK